jgi:hypothetical protein
MQNVDYRYVGPIRTNRPFGPADSIVNSHPLHSSNSFEGQRFGQTSVYAQTIRIILEVTGSALHLQIFGITRRQGLGRYRSAVKWNAICDLYSSILELR